MTIHGLDISKWQGKITAATVAAMKAQGVQFCYLKTSQGSGYKDPQVREQRATASGRRYPDRPVPFHHHRQRQRPIQLVLCVHGRHPLGSASCAGLRGVHGGR